MKLILGTYKYTAEKEMGRISRQRKYKACDPFSKRQVIQDKSFDRPPSKKELHEEDSHFSETVTFHKFQSSLDRAKNANKKKKNDKQKAKVGVTKKSKGKGQKLTAEEMTRKAVKLPNETDKEYFSRLDRNIQDTFNDAMADCKKVRQKRKEHLKERDKKKRNAQKNKKKEIDPDFTSLKDEVKFGERVDAPPMLTAAPRNAIKLEGSKTRNSGLQLASLLNNNKSKQSTDGSKKRRRDMTEIEKQTFDTHRQQAIDAYRLAKKRREESRGMT